MFAGRKRVFWGAVFAVITASVCFLVGGSLLKCAAIAAMFMGASLIKVKIPSQWTIGIATIEILLSSFVALYLSQFVLGEGLASVAGISRLLGYCCCAIFVEILFFVVPNIRIASATALALVLVLSTANWFVFAFRGTELHFVDLFSIGTAANVVSQYEYEPSANMVYGWAIYFLYVYGLGSVESDPIQWKSRKHFQACIPCLVSVLVFCIWSGTVSVHHFGKDGTYKNGYLLNFVLTIEEIVVDKPDNYSSEQAELISEEYVSTGGGHPSPSVIVIMDEAYADLSILGNEINANIAVSPFISALEQNTIKGYALSSAYGGRTANSEFEFLTGFTMGFLPNGSIAYQQFIQEDQYSIVTQFRSMGYQTVAAHPYYANGWMRDTVWPMLGFDESFFLEDFPQEDLIRELVSDEEMVNFVISCYEERNSGQPLFFYGVTMQNHSGYDYMGQEFDCAVTLNGYDKNYSDAEQYLTLIHETDQAIERLISYFSGVDEPVIVMFYGDHLPALNQNFYEEIHGGTFASLDEQMLQYMVPFFIWANYDIEEHHVECTSLSYLSTYLFEAAGVELPAYNQFLKEVEENVPSLNMLGYYSKEHGCFLAYDEASGVEKEWLDRYHIIQYNALFDEENRCALFSVD